MKRLSNNLFLQSLKPRYSASCFAQRRVTQYATQQKGFSVGFFGVRYFSTPMEVVTVKPENAPIAPHVKELADKVSKLTLMELMDFSRAVSINLGLPSEALLSGATAAPVAAAPQQAQQTEQAEKKEEKKEEAAPAAAKSTVTIKLTKVDEGSKYKILKEIRTLKPGMNLTESKTLVEAVPSVLKENVPREEAVKWAEKIKAAGGEVTLE